jgi:hypothetical protein
MYKGSERLRPGWGKGKRVVKTTKAKVKRQKAKVKRFNAS